MRHLALRFGQRVAQCLMGGHSATEAVATARTACMPLAMVRYGDPATSGASAAIDDLRALLALPQLRAATS